MATRREQRVVATQGPPTGGGCFSCGLHRCGTLSNPVSSFPSQRTSGSGCSLGWKRADRVGERSAPVQTTGETAATGGWTLGGNNTLFPPRCHPPALKDGPLPCLHAFSGFE